MERGLGRVALGMAALCCLLPAASPHQPGGSGWRQDQAQNLANLAAQMRQLQDAVGQQGRVIKNQDRLIEEQGKKIASLEKTKWVQNLENGPEGKKHYLSSSMENQMRLLKDTVSQQSHVIKEHGEKIASLEKSKCGQKREQNLDNEAEGNIRQKYDVRSPMDTEGFSTIDSSSGMLHAVPQSPRRVARSDDVGPLEVSLAHVTRRVDNMAAKMAALEAHHGAASSMFVRWGSETCGAHAEQVYHGVVGGSFYTAPGAAVNFLCLPLNPILSEAPKRAEAYLYGAEYQTFDSLEHKDPVCSVCRASLATTLMTPATSACPGGWTKHYDGYLMAGAANQNAGTEFICVDPVMQVAMHSDKDENGKLLYYTRTRCGSLPCSPYADDKLVTCVVCSK